MARPPLAELVAPDHTAVLTVELQRGVVGPDAVIAELGEVARARGVLDAAGRVCRAARRAGARVVHATVRHRPDGAGESHNTRLFALLRRARERTGHSPTEDGRPGVELVTEVGRDPRDIEVARIHGVTAFSGTELDAILRNLGIRTVVVVGVSLNLGVVGAVLGAADRGYEVVVVDDAVVGLPVEYGEAVLAGTCAMVATLVSSAELVAAWGDTPVA
ncbi:MAG: isochorismatase family protein [Actinomyces sp.]|nr:MAG: isochorismatase family protein [Actinomyces sp.]